MGNDIVTIIVLAVLALVLLGDRLRGPSLAPPQPPAVRWRACSLLQRAPAPSTAPGDRRQPSTCSERRPPGARCAARLRVASAPGGRAHVRGVRTAESIERSREARYPLRAPLYASIAG